MGADRVALLEAGLMWTYRAAIGRWLDADTVDAVVDLGFRVHMDLRLRLVGSKYSVDAYERSGGTAETRERGRLGLSRVQQLAPTGAVVTVVTAKDTPSGGFDRYLAQIITPQGVNIGDALLDEGLAVVYKR